MIETNEYIVLDDTERYIDKGAPVNVGENKEQKIIGVTLILLAITIALTQIQQVCINANTGKAGIDLVDLNRATKQELEVLPDIGPILACRIIEARPFYSVEELKNICGIGETIFVKVRRLVKVD